MRSAEQRRDRLGTPTDGRRLSLNLDPDVVGIYSERVARFLGTGRYLAIQTVIVIVWIIINLVWISVRWDPYPFILLNLAFSTQAAYAAPLILLAQNRQELRDRSSITEDRARAAQTKADTEFLARELAGVRLALGETVTRDYLRRELDDLLDQLAERTAVVLRDAQAPATGPSGSDPAGDDLPGDPAETPRRPPDAAR